MSLAHAQRQLSRVFPTLNNPQQAIRELQSLNRLVTGAPVEFVTTLNLDTGQLLRSSHPQSRVKLYAQRFDSYSLALNAHFNPSLAHWHNHPGLAVISPPDVEHYVDDGIQNILVASPLNRTLMAVRMPEYLPNQAQLYDKQIDAIHKATVEADKIRDQAYNAAGAYELFSHHKLEPHQQTRLNRLLQKSKDYSSHNAYLARVNPEEYRQGLLNDGFEPAEVEKASRQHRLPPGQYNRLRRGYGDFQAARRRVAELKPVQSAFMQGAHHLRREVERNGGRMEIIRFPDP